MNLDYAIKSLEQLKETLLNRFGENELDKYTDKVVESLKNDIDNRIDSINYAIRILENNKE